MWNEPTEKDLVALPRIYETESIALDEKIIHMHFFIGACDWYAAEYDGEDKFFGYVILNGDLDCAEWGYFSLEELKSINVKGFEIDRDLYWKTLSFAEVMKERS